MDSVDELEPVICFIDLVLLLLNKVHEHILEQLERWIFFLISSRSLSLFLFWYWFLGLLLWSGLVAFSFEGLKAVDKHAHLLALFLIFLLLDDCDFQLPNESSDVRLRQLGLF